MTPTPKERGERVVTKWIEGPESVASRDCSRLAIMVEDEIREAEQGALEGASERVMQWVGTSEALLDAGEIGDLLATIRGCCGSPPGVCYCGECEGTP